VWTSVLYLLNVIHWLFINTDDIHWSFINSDGHSCLATHPSVVDSRRQSRKNGDVRRMHRPDHPNNGAPDKGAAASHLHKGSKPPASARFAGWPLRKETSERDLARTYEHLWQAYIGKIHERLNVGISGLRKVPWTPASASTARSANATGAMASASTTPSGVWRADEAQSDRCQAFFDEAQSDRCQAFFSVVQVGSYCTRSQLQVSRNVNALTLTQALGFSERERAHADASVRFLGTFCIAAYVASERRVLYSRSRSFVL
jgi:hypothetical protein